MDPPLGDHRDRQVAGEPGDQVEVRQTIEQGLAGRIVAAFDEPLRRELLDLADQMAERAARGEPFIEPDREFHLLLMEPLGNELITQLTAAFWDVHAIVARALDASPESVRETVEAHHAIVTAAAARDVAAFTRAVEAHYAPVRRRLQEGPGRRDPVA
ncbi:hypothetical protein GCM10010466_67260 [Planomonospora alba]|uniref:GntR C-terminal domain-containing protein n=1 Tax=Planomonospora alba TaxID=161354 RepID=A0ABP6P441_9ACTN